MSQLSAGCCSRDRPQFGPWTLRCAHCYNVSLLWCLQVRFLCNLLSAPLDEMHQQYNFGLLGLTSSWIKMTLMPYRLSMGLQRSSAFYLESSVQLYDDVCWNFHHLRSLTFLIVMTTRDSLVAATLGMLISRQKRCSSGKKRVLIRQQIMFIKQQRMFIGRQKMFISKKGQRSFAMPMQCRCAVAQSRTPQRLRAWSKQQLQQTRKGQVEPPIQWYPVFLNLFKTAQRSTPNWCRIAQGELRVPAQGKALGSARSIQRWHMASLVTWTTSTMCTLPMQPTMPSEGPGPRKRFTSGASLPP